MSGTMEITGSVGDQLTHQIRSTLTKTIKIQNFKRFTNTQEEFRSKQTEIFPGKKITFVVKTLPVKDSSGQEYTKYLQDGSWQAITKNDKFFTLELLAGEGVDVDLPRLAGKVEIILVENKNQAFNFGDPKKDEYLKFDVSNRSLALKPAKLSKIQSGGSNPELAASLIHVVVTDAAGDEDTLQVRFTLFTETEERSLPYTLQSARYLSDQTMRIMEDESTADLKITCGVKENKTIFKVHKNVFCASSPVFRAAIASDMLEGRTKEIYIEEVDGKTVQEMINYVYTGELTGEDLNVQMVAWVADKYDLPGMMDLLCCRMKQVEVVEPEIIADMLIAAGKHKHISSSLLDNNFVFSQPDTTPTT